MIRTDLSHVTQKFSMKYLLIIVCHERSEQLFLAGIYLT